MKDYFFTSDTHFGHIRMLEYRPFASLQEMDEALIANWNAVVKPGDDVFHLGDFAWRDGQHYLSRLTGNIHKIKGNHHKATKKIEKDFIWYRDVMEVKIPYEVAPYGVCDHDCELGYAPASADVPYGNHRTHHHQCAARFPVIEKQRIWLSHYAHRVWPRMQHGVWHLYGHSHGNLKEDDQLSMDVGVDAVARRLSSGLPLSPLDYRPVRFDEIKVWMSQKHFTPLDHHTEEVGG